MSKHEIKNCPRCEALIECKVGSILNCPCYKIPLSDVTKNFLEQADWDCLCNTCLQHFETLGQEAKTLIFPKNSGDFIENVHFYRENQYWVFTELYHFLRGYCCQSGCRHCVYGFVKEEKTAI
ncbi:MAG: cysteine-rich CWC family protein [Saprospiraceae bacterium]|nr:cysteine-rich CWC family protein [Saprospiraceae bacterium]